MLAAHSPWFRCAPWVLALSACAAPGTTNTNNANNANNGGTPPPASRTETNGSTPASAAAPTASASAAAVPSIACRPLATPSCQVGPTKRPARSGNRKQLFSSDGKTVFYYQQKTEFDLATLRYATVSGCPLWEDVYAWDKTSVYVLEPQSCGGENCGGDYTGFGWGDMDVWFPEHFRWLEGGYGTDGQRMYNRWFEGPLKEAKPASFRVLSCGEEADDFVVGQDGDRFYVDGRLATRDTIGAARDGRRGFSGETRPARPQSPQ